MQIKKIKLKLFSLIRTDTSLILFVPAHACISTLAYPYNITPQPKLYIYKANINSIA